MAEISEEQEFSSWIDELENEGEAAVAAADREDRQAEKQETVKKAQKNEDEVVSRAEYLTDQFLLTASEQEKALFAIYAHGTMGPDQVKRAIELARTNAAEAAKVTEEKVEEQAEKKADQIAAESYGVGPLQNGPPPPKPDQDKEDIERISKGGPDLSRNLAESIFRDDPVLGKFFQKQ